MIKILLIGMLVGVCNVIPGVSGGTMVVIFNIYDEFMDITSLKIKKIFSSIKYKERKVKNSPSAMKNLF